MTGYLMDRKERFQATGLLPEDLPPFLNGYQRGTEMWVYEQPSAYYRRHLLLHEGTHAFMNTQLRGCGPPWYMEGMAELMGTHRWQDGQLQLAYFPKHRDEVPQWGRIKMIRDEVAAGRSMTLEAIAAYGPTAHLQNEPYAWCWAAAAFLDGHPQFSARFRQLPERRAGQSRGVLRELLGAVRGGPAAAGGTVAVVCAAARLRVRLAARGDCVRSAGSGSGGNPGDPGPGRSRLAVVRCAGGGGDDLRARGSGALPGRRASREIWWCEPGGVTIRYYAGRPLGMLLAAASDESQPLAGLSPLTQPDADRIGSRRSSSRRRARCFCGSTTRRRNWPTMRANWWCGSAAGVSWRCSTTVSVHRGRPEGGRPRANARVASGTRTEWPPIDERAYAPQQCTRSAL